MYICGTDRQYFRTHNNGDNCGRYSSMCYSNCGNACDNQGRLKSSKQVSVTKYRTKYKTVTSTSNICHYIGSVSGWSECSGGLQSAIVKPGDWTSTSGRSCSHVDLERECGMCGLATSSPSSTGDIKDDDRCMYGTPSPSEPILVNDSGDSWTWTCDGESSGSGDDASCSTGKSACQITADLNANPGSGSVSFNTNLSVSNLTATKGSVGNDISYSEKNCGTMDPALGTGSSSACNYSNNGTYNPSVKVSVDCLDDGTTASATINTNVQAYGCVAGDNVSSATICSGDNKDLEVSGINPPRVLVGEDAANCTSGTKCEYYCNSPAYLGSAGVCVVDGDCAEPSSQSLKSDNCGKFFSQGDALCDVGDLSTISPNGETETCEWVCDNTSGNNSPACSASLSVGVSNWIEVPSE